MKQRMLKVMERSQRKAILPVISSEPEYLKWMGFLSRVNLVIIDNHRDKKGRCPQCSRSFDNVLTFVLHLETAHRGELNVASYVFYQDTLTIELAKEEAVGVLQEYLVEEGDRFTLLMTHKSRTREVLDRIFGKFQRKQEASKRQYFSPIDIFKPLSPNADQMDEEYQQVEQIERDLERLRIGEFSDVNESDKAFFVSWNESVRQYKQEREVVTGSSIEKLVDDFAVKAKREGLSRVNLVMHGWTLWSSGKISAEELTLMLKRYDDTTS